MHDVKTDTYFISVCLISHSIATRWVECLAPLPNPPHTHLPSRGSPPFAGTVRQRSGEEMGRRVHILPDREKQPETNAQRVDNRDCVCSTIPLRWGYGDACIYDMTFPRKQNRNIRLTRDGGMAIKGASRRS